MLQTLHTGIMLPISTIAHPRLSPAPYTNAGIISVRALQKPKQQERKPPTSADPYSDRLSRTNEENAVVTATQLLELKGTVLLERQNFLDLSNQVANVADKLGELVGEKVQIRLVSVEIDAGTGRGKLSEKANIEGWIFKPDVWTADAGTEYSIKFKVDKDFGIPGALLVENHHPNAFFLGHVTLEWPPELGGQRQIHFPCNSWVYNHSKYVAGHRIFFSNEAYLRSQTPSGLQNLRLSELEQLRGDGTGQRLESDRIYDYDVYNDLGNPDKGKEFSRPVLGGSKEFPYPRRCRTGRGPTQTDPKSETPASVLGSSYYVPRDEQFGRIKNSDFLASALKSIAHDLVPIIKMFLRKSPEFRSCSEIYELYSEIQALRARSNSTNKKMMENKGEDPLEIVRAFTDPRGGDPNFWRYPVPEIIQAGDTEWARDEEFARQRLSGMNPMVIERLTVFPPVSSLDPKVYGPPTSSITAQHIESNLEGLTVQEALQHNKLYTVDYHDVYLPYLERINALEDGNKAYASRTLLFLTKEGTLKPVAIELSLPPTADDQGTLSGNNRVFVPPLSGEKDWLWQLAKTHATINDMGVHELVSHWLRTHACMEPFIIASHRQLSVLHPLHVLLLPHFKYTMNINAIARKNLVNCFDGSVLNGGIIEAGFSPGRYSMEMSSVEYKGWRFDKEGLPADLLKRGMAVEDDSAKHGLRLTIEDYPFAVDGLDIWYAIKEWVREYLSIYYEDDIAVQKDSELQEWWKEIREKGHGDKKDEEWWVKMTSVGDLEEVLVTIIWVASAHHAAVNFGQFSYAGFMPNMPSMGRRLISLKDDQDLKRFSPQPPGFFLSSISTEAQSVVIMAVLEILSTHASDEEYLGHRSIPHWTSNPKVLKAFDRFKHNLAHIEQLISQRNQNPRLKNRTGPPMIPYTLLSPSSTPGLTGRGIPNSTSI